MSLVEWSWQDWRSAEPKWQTLSDSQAAQVEAEYQAHLADKGHGHRVYHCFGNGCSAIIDFDKMVTNCGSGKCAMKNHPFLRTGLARDHMAFNLERNTISLK